MKAGISIAAVTILMLIAGTALAQTMGGGHMGGGNGHMGPGPNPNPAPNTGHMSYGRGYGMGGVGGMGSMMYGNTISRGYADELSPIADAAAARAAIQAFIDASNSTLEISELWEYETAYEAELSDSAGAKAFDLIADKFTGAVMPEMGHSMMLNATYGRYLYRTSAFRRNLSVGADEATVLAETFVTKNSLGYTLEAPEIYPGYYKFHTRQETALGMALGMDIMVNGYNGKIWMNTLLGLPLHEH